MPEESNIYSNNSIIFTSTDSKSSMMMVMKGGGKNLNSHEITTSSYITTEETINDDELAQRKAEAAASRRYEATEWLRKMDHTASEALSKRPSEEEFCLALRNGLILCNILNKVNSGAVSKVVENPIITIQSSDGTAQSAIQYFENMRNFLMAVGDMKLLTFEASDLEKGGSSVKVVDCILCLKGYHEWKQAGGTGTWRYGGTVKITSLPKGPSLIGSENAEDMLDEPDCPPDQQLLEFLHHSADVSLEESKAANALIFLFDSFGLGLLKTYLTKWNEIEDLPVNAMLVDAILKKVVQDFRSLLLSHGNQLGLLLKETLKGGNKSVSREEFLEAISNYIRQRTYDISDDFSKFCICNGKHGAKVQSDNQNVRHLERLELQEKQLEELKLVFQDTRVEVKQVQQDWREELKKLENNIEGLEVASSSYHKLLEENRLLYNQVQDLKGSIRVYCRVRPFLPEQSDCQSTVDYIGENGDIMVVNPHKQGKEARKVFSFNKVFSTSVTQEQVFADTRPLIRSVLDGFNVCIFAYGQTGSGKTYTMSGPDLTTEETWGVNYRALNDLFQISKSRMDVIAYEVSVQMIEIYNEQVRDLLVSDGSNRRLDIRNTSQLNGLNVPDASLIPVKCIQDVLDLMRTGQRNRAVGATALNERSSRSHSVLAIHVHGKELVSGSILRGCLHLVDLAGSERVDKSEAVGERLKEAQHINRSLSALGDVISALAQKSSHIPYRNSKLTQVLQDSLGGHAKTLMFVHINPEANAIGETISTLKFAERVASIELGAARSNKETGEIKELKEEISSLKLALQRKESEMEQLKGGNVPINMDMKIIRTLSPLHMPRNGITVLKHELLQHPVNETRSTEIRSCSSGKQRRSRLPSKFTDKDPILKISCLAEERFVNSRKPRTPSPPIRRSLSTDRGVMIKSRLKLDTLDNQPAVKLQFPVLAAVNKSVAALPSIPANGKVTKGYWEKSVAAPHEQPKVNVHDTFSNFHVTNSRKLHPEHEEEQFKQVLNVRQGGIRKNKPDSKAKAKHQMPVRMQNSDLALTLLSDKDLVSKVEESRKGDFLETENEHGVLESPMRGTLKVKKLRQNFTRISQNLERRGLMQAVEPLLAEKQENKLPNGVIRYGKEVTKASMPDFRRSRSSPRGKFTILP